MRSVIAGGYELDDDRARVDMDALWAFLSREAYWGRWRTRPDVECQVEAAWRVVALYARASGSMVGFCRAVSDGVATAYLADVYVEARHRGRGLGLSLVRAMVDGGPAKLHWMLHTTDAHGFYRMLGFTEPDHRYLERRSGTR